MNYQRLYEDPEYYSTVDDDFDDEFEDEMISYDDLLEYDISTVENYYGA